MDVASYTGRVASALSLFHYVRWMEDALPEIGTFHDWAMIACRDTVMSISHFRHEMFAANEIANTCEAISADVEKDTLRLASRAFKRSFPTFPEFRHAVAHEGEIGSKPTGRDSFNKHSFSGSARVGGIMAEQVEGLMISPRLDGRNYSATFSGQILTIEMGWANVEALAEVANIFFRAFTAFRSPRHDGKLPWPRSGADPI